MSAPKFTPWPWRWEGGVRTAPFVMGAGGERIGQIGSGVVDAALIAAAPDLYAQGERNVEALKQLRDLFGELEIVDGPQGTCGSIIDTLIDENLGAISKARGE